MQVCTNPSVGTCCRVLLTEAGIEGGKLVLYGHTEEKSQADLDLMIDELQDISPGLTTANAQIGLQCISQFKADKLWYRAVVIQELINNYWRVKFIDYGNQEEVQAREIRVLPDNLKVLPPQAVAMLLQHDLRPCHSAALWTPAIAQIIINHFLYQNLTIQVTESCEPGRLKVNCKELKEALLASKFVEEGVQYPFCKFLIGSKFDAYMSTAADDGTLFMQEVTSACALDYFMDNMSQFFAVPGSRTSLPRKNFVPGTLVATVYSQDQGIYRAKILDVNGDSCTVHFIDYGDCEQQEHESLFVLPQEFCTLEYQAVPCKLHKVSIYPECYSEARKKLNHVTAEKMLNIEVIEHCESPDVHLAVKVLFEGQDISSELISDGLAKLDTETRLISEEIKAQLKFRDLQVGQLYSGIVSHVETNNTFYFTLLDALDSLDDLMDGIAEYCSNPATPCLCSVHVGMSCCALFDDDDIWYRAIVDKVDNSDVTVRFVDYGNTSKVPITSLKSMTSTFTTIPIQAVLCVLPQTPGSKHSDDLTTVLNEDVEINVIAKDQENMYVVDILQNVKLFSDEKFTSPETVLGQPKQYKKCVMDVGSVQTIVVTSVSDQTTFWARIISDQVDFEDFMKTLNDFYDTSACNAGDDLAVGSACCVQDPITTKWHRGKVASRNGSMLQVLLVDNGLVKDFNCMVVKSVCEKLLALPVQAFEVILQVSPNLNFPKISENAEFKAIIESCDASMDTYTVELCCEQANSSIPALFHIAPTLRLPSADTKKYHLEISNLGTPCIALGTPVKVAVCFVEDPDCLWIQQCSMEKHLFNILTAMKIFYNSLCENELSFDHPQVDQLCCVKHEHSNGTCDWYRGRILCSYGNKVEVKFIDFGNDVCANADDVKILALQFLEPKAMALKCKLNNVTPSDKRWTEKAIHDLKKLLGNSDSSIFGKFVKTQHSTYLVDLTVENTKEKCDVSSFLVDKGHAAPPPTAVSASLVASCDSHQEKAGLCSARESVKASKLFYTCRGMAPIGAQLEVAICSVHSPDELFVRVLGDQFRKRHDALFTNLNRIVKGEISVPPLQGELYIGMPCAVYDLVFKNWCRGALLKFSDLTNISVCLVDHGRIITTQLDKLKSIDSELVTSEPPASLRCTLQGTVKPLQESWSEEGLNLCRSFLDNNSQKLTCTIHGCIGGDAGLYWMCSFQSPMGNLATLLTEADHCTKTAYLGKLSPPLKLKSFVYSNLDLVLGKEDQFYITHIENVALFYCQLKRNFELFDKMMDELQKVCTENVSKTTAEEVIKDWMCFARYNGEQWYRAHLIQSLSTACAEVLFVDYGNSGIVPWSDICRFQGEQFLKIPIMAVPCCLSDESLVDALDQKEKILEQMKELLHENLFEGVVTGGTNGKLHLDLFQEDTRLNDTIVKMFKCTSQVSKQPVDLHAREDVMESTYCAELADPFFVRVGCKEQVMPSFIVNPREFYLQFVRLEENRAICEASVDGFYTAKRNSDYPVTSLKHGDTICAQDTSMQWHRAVVLPPSQANDPFVKVRYVDTGESDMVEKHLHVKQLVSSMTKWPKMAVTCKLAGVCPADGDQWTSGALALFQSLLKSEAKLTAHFMHKDESGSWIVRLHKNDTDVSLSLVDQGYAKFVEEECRAFNIQSQQKKIEVLTSKLNDGQCEEVYISHVHSCNIVYVQRVVDVDGLEKLCAEINCDVDSCDKVSSLPQPGDICLARDKGDDVYYRSRVLECTLSDCESEAEILVYFCDYGNSACVSLASIRQPKPQHCTLPEACVRCKVINVPTGLSSEEICLKLNDLSVSEDVTIFCRSSGFDDKEKCYKVNLRVGAHHGGAVTLPSFMSNTGTALTSGVCNIPKYENPKDVLEKSNVKIYICHVENPGDVYCQLAEHAGDLDALTETIAKYYSAEHPELEPISTNTLPVGSPCVARFSDGRWYRAIVKSMLDNEKLLIQFVDYGNVETIALSDIRFTKVGFCGLPVQAIHCHLAFVSTSYEVWNAEVISAFDNKVAELELSASFSNLLDEENSIYEVMLRLPDGTLLNNEYSSSQSSSIKPPATELLTSDSSEKPKSKYTSSCDIEDSKPLSPLSENFKADSFVDDGKSLSACNNDKDDFMEEEKCKLDGESLEFCENNKLKLVEDKSFELNAEKTGKTLETPVFKIIPGSVQQCYVSYAEHPYHFFVHFAEADEALEAIQKSVDKDVEANMKVDHHQLPVNYHCLAKSPEDHIYYRARITEIGEKLKVLFIDYGNSVVVDWSDILLSSDATNEFPIQAVQCYINKAPSVSGEDVVNKTAETFLNVVMEHLLNITFVCEMKEEHIWKVKVEVNGVDVLKLMSPTCESVNKVCDVGSKQISSDNKKDEHLLPNDKITAMAQSCEKQEEYFEHFAAGDSGLCVVTHVVDPDLIFVKPAHNDMYEDFDLVVEQHASAMTKVDKDFTGSCLAKLVNDQKWQRATVKSHSDGTKTLFFVDTGLVVNSRMARLHQLPEQLKSYPCGVLCCTRAGDDSLNAKEVLACVVDGDQVMVTFLTSSYVMMLGVAVKVWRVKLSKVNKNCVVQSVDPCKILSEFSHVILGDLSVVTSEKTVDKHFDPCGISTPLVPEIIVTDVDETSEPCGKTINISSDESTEREYVSGCTTTVNKDLPPSSKHYLQIVQHDLKEIKSLCEKSAAQGDILNLIDKVTNTVSTCVQAMCKHVVSADGDKNLHDLVNEDNKRPSSPLPPFLTSPCKKPRLGCSVLSDVKSGTFEQVVSLEHGHIWGLPSPPYGSGDEDDVHVSCINDPSSFFVKPYFLLPHEKYLKKCVAKSMRIPFPYATVGQPCLFKGKHEKMKFYRGIVKDVQKNQVTVVDLDSGNTHSASKKHLYKLLTDVMALPSLSVHCCLYGIEPVGKKWTREAIDCFSNQLNVCIEQQCIHVTFCKLVPREGYKWMVELTHDVDLGQYLVEKNFAKRTDDAITSTEEVIIEVGMDTHASSNHLPLSDIKSTLSTAADFVPSDVSSSNSNWQCLPSHSDLNPTVLPVSVASTYSTSCSASDSVFIDEQKQSPLLAPLGETGITQSKTWRIYHSSTDRPIHYEEHGTRINSAVTIPEASMAGHEKFNLVNSKLDEGDFIDKFREELAIKKDDQGLTASDETVESMCSQMMLPIHEEQRVEQQASARGNELSGKRHNVTTFDEAPSLSRVRSDEEDTGLIEVATVVVQQALASAFHTVSGQTSSNDFPLDYENTPDKKDSFACKAVSNQPTEVCDCAAETSRSFTDVGKDGEVALVDGREEQAVVDGGLLATSVNNISKKDLPSEDQETADVTNDVTAVKGVIIDTENCLQSTPCDKSSEIYSTLLEANKEASQSCDVIEFAQDNEKVRDGVTTAVCDIQIDSVRSPEKSTLSAHAFEDSKIQAGETDVEDSNEGLDYQDFDQSAATDVTDLLDYDNSSHYEASSPVKSPDVHFEDDVYTIDVTCNQEKINVSSVYSTPLASCKEPAVTNEPQPESEISPTIRHTLARDETKDLAISCVRDSNSTDV